MDLLLLRLLLLLLLQPLLLLLLLLCGRHADHLGGSSLHPKLVTG